MLTVLPLAVVPLDGIARNRRTDVAGDRRCVDSKRWTYLSSFWPG